MSSRKDAFDQWLPVEIRLSQKHEEILARREALLENRGTQAAGKEKKIDNMIIEQQQAKTRNQKLREDIEESQKHLRQKTFSSASAQFIGLQESYWKMVEAEAPGWFAHSTSTPRGNSRRYQET